VVVVVVVVRNEFGKKYQHSISEFSKNFDSGINMSTATATGR
jgi:hypothetical protein